MVIAIIIGLVLIGIVVGIAVRPGRRMGSSTWREERHESADGQHVVEETHFD